MFGDALEHAARHVLIAGADAAQRGADTGLDRTAVHGVELRPARGEPQDDAPPIASIVDALQEPLRGEPPEHARQCARVHVKDRGQFSRGQFRKESYDAKYQTLRPGDADFGAHPLRAPLHAMNDGPQLLHELQDIG